MPDPVKTSLIGMIRFRMQHCEGRSDFTVYGTLATESPVVGVKRVGVDRNDVAILSRIGRADAQQLLDDMWSLGIRPTSQCPAESGSLYLDSQGARMRRREHPADLGDNYPVLHDMSELDVPGAS
jgi:hypothetical protein